MEAPATIVFDGICNLCNATVAFVSANDPARRFRCVASQSEEGRALLSTAGRDPRDVTSIILIDAAGVHERSDAALRIAAGLRPPWNSLRVLRVIPAAVRDPLYDWIARNRYRWFGRRR